MPKKKTTTKKVPSQKVEIMNTVETPQERKTTKSLVAFLIFAAILLVALYLFKNKSLVMVATVDGTPIWRPAFEQQIISDSGSKVLDQMVTEQIIMNEAARRHIQVSDAEVNQKIADIQKTLPQGTTLDAALAGQGMTMQMLQKQLYLQLLIEKMLPTNIKISDAEIAKYIEDNRSFLTSTDEAGLQMEARQALTNQKKNAEFQKLLDTLKKNAKVSKYL